MSRWFSNLSASAPVDQQGLPGSSAQASDVKSFMDALCLRKDLGLQTRVDTGCWHRAHRISMLIQQQRWIAGKLWAIASSRLFKNGRQFEPDLSQSSSGRWREVTQRWHVHVAPTVLVSSESSTQAEPISTVVVLDPLLFSHPVEVEAWFGQLRDGEGKIAYTDATCFRIHSAHQKHHNIVIDRWYLDPYYLETTKMLGPLAPSEWMQPKRLEFPDDHNRKSGNLA